MTIRKAKSLEDSHQDQDITSSNTDDHRWNPKKFRMEMRQQAVAPSLGERNENMTVDLLMTQCNALVVTNQEIWDRCKPFYCTTVEASDSETSTFVFFRLGYFHVNCSKSSKDSFSIVSMLDLTKRSFEIPRNLPAPLTRLIFSPPTTEKDVIPNCELIFERSMLLTDDVLVGFLLEFKPWLEKLQVALGEVDTWLLQSDESAHFLNKTFGVELPCDDAKRQQLHAQFLSWEYCNRSLNSYKCLRCNDYFYNHKRYEGVGWATCRRSHVASSEGCFRSPLLEEHFQHDLLRYSCEGAIDFTFCLEIPEQKRMLTHFVEFLQRKAAPSSPSHG